MRTAVTKTELESALATRFGRVVGLRDKPQAEYLATGVAEIDALTGGLPRGAITEIFGTASSGHTSLMLASIASATAEDETCALVDLYDALDVASAAAAGVQLDNLLWIRCGGNLEHAFKVTDMLLHAGGFGLVVLDIADLAPASARRIVTSWWFRFRHAIENTPTALVVVASASCTRSSATLSVEMEGRGAVWNAAAPMAARPVLMGSDVPLARVARPAAHDSHIPHSLLLSGTRLRFNRCKPIQIGKRSEDMLTEMWSQADNSSLFTRAGSGHL